MTLFAAPRPRLSVALRRALKLLARERQRQALQGAKLICDWFWENQLTGPYGEQIIEESRTIMMFEEIAGTNVAKGALYYHFESKEALGYDDNGIAFAIRCGGRGFSS